MTRRENISKLTWVFFRFPIFFPSEFDKVILVGLTTE